MPIPAHPSHQRMGWQEQVRCAVWGQLIRCGRRRASQAGLGLGFQLSSVRSGMSSKAPARKHSAPMKVPRLVSSALYIWPVDGLM